MLMETLIGITMAQDGGESPGQYHISVPFKHKQVIYAKMEAAISVHVFQGTHLGTRCHEKLKQIS